MRICCCKGPCKCSQHCWAQDVASVCTPCCVLLRVVATCWKLLDEVWPVSNFIQQVATSRYKLSLRPTLPFLKVKVEPLSTSTLNASRLYNLLCFIYAPKASQIHERNRRKIYATVEIHAYVHLTFNMHKETKFFKQPAQPGRSRNYLRNLQLNVSAYDTLIIRLCPPNTVSSPQVTCVFYLPFDHRLR